MLMPIRVRPQPKLKNTNKNPCKQYIQIPRVLGDKNKNDTNSPSVHRMLQAVGCDWAFTITTIGVTHLCGGKPAQPSLSNSVATL